MVYYKKKSQCHIGKVRADIFKSFVSTILQIKLVHNALFHISKLNIHTLQSNCQLIFVKKIKLLKNEQTLLPLLKILFLGK